MAFFKTSTAVRAPVADTGSDNTAELGTSLKSHAVELAAKEGAELIAAIDTVVKAKEEWQGGSFKVLLAMQQTYTKEELDGMPVPDSDTGNNPDKFKIEVTENGTTTMKPTTFYTLFADNTAAGKALQVEIDWLNRLSKVDANKADIPADYVEAYGTEPEKRQTRLAYLNGRRSTIRISYKNAIGLYLQFEAVGSVPNVVAEPIWADGKEGEEVENTTKPIIVRALEKDGTKSIKHYMPMSIANFKRLDPKKAVEKDGGSFKSLMATTKRATGGAANGAAPATETPVIKTVDTGLGRIVEVYRWLSEIYHDKNGADIGKLYKTLNDKTADEAVVTMVELRNMFQQIVTDCKLDPRYVKIQQSGALKDVA